MTNADLRAANEPASLPPYQRVVDANTYDTVGFPLYLQADGSDDWMQTNSVNFSASDKVFVSAGVRKLSDTARGMLAELSATTASNNGSFALTAPNAASATYAFESKGTSLTDAVGSATAPISSVLSALANISGDSNILRINGVQADSDTGDQGTGNYGNYPLYFYRRGGTTLPFNGREYASVCRGGTLPTSAQIAQVERYLSNTMGGGFA